MQITFYGATREVTGSCYLVKAGKYRILVECGLFQGAAEHERHNQDDFPFHPKDIDAVILTHAHLDHSGRIPKLVKQGFTGPIYTHPATLDLCSILFADAAYLMEREAEWENRDRRKNHEREIEPLYTRDEARYALQFFTTVEYGHPVELLDGVTLTLRDAGHILGSATAELQIQHDGQRKKIVFTGDLGHVGAPILRDPEPVPEADLVVMESTYGDRLHRPWQDTWNEMGTIFKQAKSAQGNILIPSFTVGRTQELLYAFSQHYDEWGLGDWQIFLDSPMAIEATRIYERHSRIYDQQACNWYRQNPHAFQLPNLTLSDSNDDSMRINEIVSGAIIIAGSGMCNGGRIKHHLKHNIWRENAHVMIVGFQAAGTIGRALVDGARIIRLWGKETQVKARIHTVGGLSAHADQDGLAQWYGQIKDTPPVVLVHGEAEAMDQLAQRLHKQFNIDVTQAQFGQTVLI